MFGRIVAVVVALALSLFGGGAAFADDPQVPPPTSGGGTDGSTGISAQALAQEGQRIVTGGREARALIPGVRSTIELTFRNVNDTVVRNAVAHLVAPEGTAIASPDSRIGDLAPNATGVARFDITLDDESCTDFFGAGGEVTADGIDPSFFKAGFPVACPGPRLSIETVEIGGGDGDGVPEPGETVTVTVTLRNDGADPATNVTATMQVKGDGVEAVTATASWPDIAAGESARPRAPFTMRIADDAKPQEGCQSQPGVIVEPGGTGTAGSGTVTTGTVGPDGTVTTGTVEPDVTVEPDGGPGSSEPGGAADTPVSSEPDSSGSGGGVTSPEPAPRTEPPGTEPEPGDKPQPITPVPPVYSDPAGPPPPDGSPPRDGGPEPSIEDPGVAYDALFEVTASGEKFGLEYSNRIVCAYAEGGGAVDLPVRDDKGLAPDAARASGSSRTSNGSPAAPAAIALITAAAALGIRRILIRQLTTR